MSEGNVSARALIEVLYMLYFSLPGDSGWCAPIKNIADRANGLLPKEHKLSGDDIEKINLGVTPAEMKYLRDSISQAKPGELAYPFSWRWDGDLCYVRNRAKLESSSPGVLQFVIHAHDADPRGTAITRGTIDRLLKLANSMYKMGDGIPPPEHTKDEHVNQD